MLLSSAHHSSSLIRRPSLVYFPLLIRHLSVGITQLACERGHLPRRVKTEAVVRYVPLALAKQADCGEGDTMNRMKASLGLSLRQSVIAAWEDGVEMCCTAAWAKASAHRRCSLEARTTKSLKQRLYATLKLPYTLSNLG